ncbi:hypothetical protein GBAR_LOCUS19462 [Geodia barretti]|uniref:Uncharacterized protein n=2 Tax=Geodia barretti TaxID=519541 RepID=A0AA35SS48_GEOBA|nr:hypothetical protein GBAR_LOCUS19462 [Geodia barretti]
MANFTYENSVVLSRMFYHLENTKFPGISGNEVKFDYQGIRYIDQVIIYQYLNKNSEFERVEVGSIIDIWGNSTFEPYNNSTFIFPHGDPIDGVPIEEVVNVSGVLAGIYIFLAAGGLLFATICLFFTVLFRNKRLVRISSPNLNYIIGVGTFFLYLNVITLVIATH